MIWSTLSQRQQNLIAPCQVLGSLQRRQVVAHQVFVNRDEFSPLTIDIHDASGN